MHFFSFRACQVTEIMSSTHWAALGVGNFTQQSFLLMSSEGLCTACFIISFIHSTSTAAHANRKRDSQCCSCVFNWVRVAHWGLRASISMFEPQLYVSPPGLRDFSCYFSHHMTLYCKPRPEERDVWSLTNIKRQFVSVKYLSSCWK